MKQKNVLLIAIAVMCGLAAAFATAQMNARPKEQPILDLIEVPVAAKELPVNTKLTKDEIDNFVTMKKLPKDSLPPQFVATKEELIDKRVVQVRRPGELFNPSDVSNKPTVDIPPGYNMVTFPITRDKMVGGFAGPGTRVDLLATVPVKVWARGPRTLAVQGTARNEVEKANSSFIGPILTNMLVLAVDTAATSPGTPIQAMTDVSIAVNNKQALMLQGLLSKTPDIRLMLRNPDKPPVYPFIPSDDDIWAMLGEVDASKFKEPPEVAFTILELPVPKEDIPAGTKLTDELINTKFTVAKIQPPAPENMISNIREHSGKFLLKDLTANQYVPRAFLADEMPRKPEPPKVAPAESAAPKSAPEPEQAGPLPPPPVYHDVTVHTASGVKKYRYQVLRDGNYKFLGELKPDNTPDVEGEPAAKPGKGGPKGPADDGKKVDKLIRAGW